MRWDGSGFDHVRYRRTTRDGRSGNTSLFLIPNFDRSEAPYIAINFITSQDASLTSKPTLEPRGQRIASQTQ
jgi:hypothetical protein